MLGHAERRARDEFRLRRCRGSLDVGPVARVLAVDGEVLVFGQRALVGRVDVRVARLAPREPRKSVLRNVPNTKVFVVATAADWLCTRGKWADSREDG